MWEPEQMSTMGENLQQLLRHNIKNSQVYPQQGPFTNKQLKKCSVTTDATHCNTRYTLAIGVAGLNARDESINKNRGVSSTAQRTVTDLFKNIIAAVNKVVMKFSQFMRTLTLNNICIWVKKYMCIKKNMTVLYYMSLCMHENICI